MRNLLLALVISSSACAARTATTTLPADLPHVEYACDGMTIVSHGESLELRARVASLDSVPDITAKLGWRDEAGLHFVSWPVSPTDVEAVEFIVPENPRLDAVRRDYDTSTGTSRADWRLLHSQVCTARGGYTNVLARYVNGASLDDLARELSLGSRDDARELVHHAMLSIQRRYFHDH